MKKYNRRNFLGSVPCMALGSSTLYSSLINLKAMSSLLASQSTVEDDYKALVCVLLSGGNDSFNMLIPRGNSEYSQYETVRSNQAIPQSDLLAINNSNQDGKQLGFHPNLTRLQRIYNEGNAACISNIGTLVEPIIKSSIENKSGKIPLGLFSHIDQVQHWQTAFPQDRTNKGWGGKIADIMKSMNVDNGVSMNISLGGNNIYQRGDEVIEYAINNDGGVAIAGWELRELPFFDVMIEDISDMVNKEYNDLFKDSYTGTLRRSIESNETFNAAIASNGRLRTQFAANKASQDMRMVADTIAARDVLGTKRQIFFVEVGGFDNHDELINNHGQLMSSIDDALGSFYEATEELRVADSVTTFTISDFARTLTSNGNGTDHAWGGNVLVMGGAVKGNEIYGKYPDLGLGSDLDLGKGVLIPTTSADEYFAELALWFGISPNDLHLVLPNLSNFYSYDPSSAPLQFLL